MAASRRCALYERARARGRPHEDHDLLAIRWSSDWNHGNAHFLRGIVAELRERGHEPVVYEPRDGWSRTNLLADIGRRSAASSRPHFPQLTSRTLRARGLDLDDALAGADLVLVHEWNEPGSCADRRAARRRRRFALLFHDTHHRAVTAPAEMGRYDLSPLRRACSPSASAIRRRLPRARLGRRVPGRWHEAADIARLPPAPGGPTRRRSRLDRQLGRRRAQRGAARVPARARPAALASRARCTASAIRAGALRAVGAPGLDYRGWLPNHSVPEVFARHRVTVHVPAPPVRRGAARDPDDPARSRRWPAGSRSSARRGTTPRACSRLGRTTSWRATAREMRSGTYATCCTTRSSRVSLRRRGLPTILARHTCAHRVDELLAMRARRSASSSRRRWLRENRVLRLQPRLVVLERRRDVLPRARPLRCTTRGHEVTFFEPDAYERQEHRDIADPAWARRRRLRSRDREARGRAASRARAVVDRRRQDERRRRARRRARAGGARRSRAPITIFWDVDAPATLARLEADENDALRRARADATTSCSPTAAASPSSSATARSAPAPACPSTTRSTRRRIIPWRRKRASRPTSRFLGNRLPDREERVEEFFLGAAARAPARSFLLGGTGWEARDRAQRTSAYLGHVGTGRTQRAQLQRRSRCSTSPATAWPPTAGRRRRACSRRRAPAPA